jgi:hypothetical protein
MGAVVPKTSKQTNAAKYKAQQIFVRILLFVNVTICLLHPFSYGFISLRLRLRWMKVEREETIRRNCC